MPSVSLEGLEHLPRGRADRAQRRSPARAGRAITGQRVACIAGVPIFAASPSDSTAGMRGLRERARAALDHAVDVGRDGAEVGAAPASSRRPARRAAPSSARSSRRNARQPLDVGLEVVAALGGRLRRPSLELLDRAADVRALARQRREDRVRVAREVARARCSARRGSRAPRRSPRSAGLARRITSLRSLAAAGEAGAELVEDERQPLALGLAHDVVDQVEVDRLASCCSTGSRYWPSPGALLDLLAARGGASRAGGARLRRLALDEALADQRLRAHDAARVAAEVLVAGVVDVEHDRGLEVLA